MKKTKNLSAMLLAAAIFVGFISGTLAGCTKKTDAKNPADPAETTAETDKTDKTENSPENAGIDLTSAAEPVILAAEFSFENALTMSDWIFEGIGEGKETNFRGIENGAAVFEISEKFPDILLGAANLGRITRYDRCYVKIRCNSPDKSEGPPTVEFYMNVSENVNQWDIIISEDLESTDGWQEIFVDIPDGWEGSIIGFAFFMHGNGIYGTYEVARIGLTSPPHKNRFAHEIQARDADGKPVISAVNVKNFGAAGDKKTDDTAAFAAALEEAEMMGGALVFVPPGEYRITKKLYIPQNTTLRGIWAPPPADGDYTGQSVISIDMPPEPADGQGFISAGGSAAIRDLTFVYPNQDDPGNIKEYPPTIQPKGAVMAYENLTFVNSYTGIDAAYQFGGSVHNVNNIYGSFLNMGVFNHFNLDISRFSNITADPDIWGNYAGFDPAGKSSVRDYMKNNATVLKVGKIDDFFVYNISAGEEDAKCGLEIWHDEDYPMDPNWNGGEGYYSTAYGWAYGVQKDLRKIKYGPKQTQLCVMFIDDIPELGDVSDSLPPDRPDYSRVYSSVPAKLYNVKDYGAAGDRVTPDGAAIQGALDHAGANGGGIVYLPSGTYLVERLLTVPKGVELAGEWESPVPCSPSVLIFDVLSAEGDNCRPGSGYITLEQNSGVSGLKIILKNFVKPEEVFTDTTDKYKSPLPAIIKGAGPDIWVRNTNFENAYDGIDFWQSRCDNFIIDGVWGWISRTGIAIGGGTDGGYIRDTMIHHIKYGVWEDNRAYVFGDAKNIDGFSVCNFNHFIGADFVSQNGNSPENIKIMRLVLDDPASKKAMRLESGDNLVFIGVSSSGGAGAGIFAEEVFPDTSKARVYGQLDWSQKPFVTNGKDVIIY